MTWHANEIILQASPAALAWVRAQPLLLPYAYHLPDLEGYKWFTPKVRHSLPPDGLLFIQPVAPLPEDDDAGRVPRGWAGPALDWTLLGAENLNQATAGSSPDGLNAGIESALLEHEIAAPPLPLRRFLHAVAETLGQTVLYYQCFMWGGDVEQEYCLGYEPQESLLVTLTEPRGGDPARKDALRDGLALLGLHLPGPYFAPHTGAIEWDKFRMRP